MRPVLFFADRLPPLIGGMEMHAGAFIDHFCNHPRYPLLAVVTKDTQGRDLVLQDDVQTPATPATLPAALLVAPAILFFNSGRWIEDLHSLRDAFPTALFVYRTGGNEILKAPLNQRMIADHGERQRFWLRQLANYVDVLVTNSAFTDARLSDLGLSGVRVARCVGGVDLRALREAGAPGPTDDRPPVLFCAARFVPYKNHALLLDTCASLAEIGQDFELRLAGDGPLLVSAQERCAKLGLTSRVRFLGALDNHNACREIAASDVYIQFSVDQETKVPGGRYVHAEGMGRSILEAISCGTYVVALRSGALPEVVTPDRGLLLSLAPRDVLAQQIAGLLKAPSPRPAPTDEFGWPTYFKQYEILWGAPHATARCH